MKKIMFIALFCLSAVSWADMAIKIDGKVDTNVTLKALTAYTITVADVGPVQSDLTLEFGFFAQANPTLGTLEFKQALAAAGSKPEIITGTDPDFQTYQITPGSDSTLGDQFEFTYTPDRLGETVFQLIQPHVGVLAMVEIKIKDPSQSTPVDNSFTYQGRVNLDGNPADGLFDMKFALFKEPASSNFGQVGPTLEIMDIQASGGYFTVELDFGNGIFDGNKRWLDISIRPADSDDPADYEHLTPKQELTPSPYAIHALTTSKDELIDQLNSKVAQLESQVQSLQATVDSLQTSITQLTDTLSGVTRTNDTITFNGVNVQITNGSGYTNITNSLGNLIVGYNETREDDENTRTGSHNIIVGKMNNFSKYGGIVSGYNNEISGIYASITGGLGNVADGSYSSITGGGYNYATGNYTSISGGINNTTEGIYSSISGGRGNKTVGQFSSILGGGSSNLALGNTAEGDYSTISGGQNNTAQGNYSWIGGGRNNTTSSAYYSAVSGERPLYDSGWVDINQDQAIILTHNLGGDEDNYTVEYWQKGPGLGITNAGEGFVISNVSGGGYGGSYWFGLTDTTIRVRRAFDDEIVNQVRVRIYVNK